MRISTETPHPKGWRFPRAIIAGAVRAYSRLVLSPADVAGPRAERGRETGRKRMTRFGRHVAHCIKRDRPAASDKWRLDEVVVPINGEKFRLWRAVDRPGDRLDVLVQPKRNAKAARVFWGTVDHPV